MIKEKIENQIQSVKNYRKDLIEPHKIKNLGDGVFAIREGVFSYCFLITGESKALLIDGGIGVPGLKEKIETVTGLPVIQVLTGAFPWTVGSSGEFHETYVLSKDLALASLSNNFLLRRVVNFFDPLRVFLGRDRKILKRKGEFSKLEKQFNKKEIDLGDRIVTFKELPGITKGGCGFCDEKTGVVFCGSAAGPLIILIPIISATAQEYYDSVKAIRKKAGEKRIYTSYSFKPVMKIGMEELESLMYSETKKGNNSDLSQPLRFVSSDKHLRFLLHFPARTERKPLKKKWEEIKG